MMNSVIESTSSEDANRKEIESIRKMLAFASRSARDIGEARASAAIDVAIEELESSLSARTLN
ncbi:MAG: hypothetical protein AAF360_13565 [Pseudomonadota bacterium]